MIWSEHPEHGYQSSHRVLSSGRHRGRGRKRDITGRDFAMCNVAVRGSMPGSHDGYDGFGRHTGAEVCIIRYTRAAFGPGGVRHERTVHDGFPICQRIMLHAGTA